MAVFLLKVKEVKQTGCMLLLFAAIRMKSVACF